MLKIENISLAYGENVVVDQVSLTVNAGERLAIVGPSGCGKTTLLKGLSGHLPLKEGAIYFNGQKMKDVRKQLIPGFDFCRLVHQDFNLNDFHTVEENIRLRLLSYDEDYQNNRLSELLVVTGLSKLKKRVATDLSGGQKQRLALARALADEPQMIVMDEPFNQLDFNIRQQIEQYLFEYLKRESIAVIIVTHNGEEAMRWGQSIAFMNQKKIRRIDTAEHFYRQPQTAFEAGFFGEINVIKMDGIERMFRPDDFSIQLNQSKITPLAVTFMSKSFKGWYTSYRFSTPFGFITLFSTEDISDIHQVYI